jgi:hypothetical protein
MMDNCLGKTHLTENGRLRSSALRGRRVAAAFELLGRSCKKATQGCGYGDNSKARQISRL